MIAFWRPTVYGSDFGEDFLSGGGKKASAAWDEMR